MNSLKIIETKDDTIKLGTTCFNCGAENVVEIGYYGYYLWQIKGDLIQDALPELSDSEREILISGMCKDCQKNFFN